MKITFVGAGGTIDKDYAACAGTYNFEISDPAVKEILENANPNFEYDIVSLLRKDSLDMDDIDRQLLFNACSKMLGNKIIITHGTDTMIDTAKKLCTLENKVIVIVGASKPEKFRDSDASFNVGVAVGAINVLGEGVYIAMNGKIYKPDEVQKISNTGKFMEK